MSADPAPDDPDRPDAGGKASAIPHAERGPAPSPCVGVCRIVEREARCAGCLRTLDEITAWSRLDDEARYDLLTDLERRRQRAEDGGIE